MKKIFPSLFLIFIISFTLTSCTGNGTIPPPPEPPPPSYTIPNVPYVISTTSCLPAAAENVYLYWGKNVPQEELVDIIGSPGNESKLVLDARERGFNANIFRATQDELNQIIYENDTLIILKIVSPSSPTAQHAIIMTGYDNINKEIIYISNGEGKDLKMSYSKLLSLSCNPYNPEKQISIMICPKDINPDLPDIHL